MQIRHTRGPMEVTIGQTALVLDQWTETELQLHELPPALIAEFGIEVLGHVNTAVAEEATRPTKARKEVSDG